MRRGTVPPSPGGVCRRNAALPTPGREPGDPARWRSSLPSRCVSLQGSKPPRLRSFVTGDCDACAERVTSLIYLFGEPRTFSSKRPTLYAPQTWLSGNCPQTAGSGRLVQVTIAPSAHLHGGWIRRSRCSETRSHSICQMKAKHIERTRCCSMPTSEGRCPTDARCSESSHACADSERRVALFAAHREHDQPVVRVRTWAPGGRRFTAFACATVACCWP